jgi:hypothetical protein
MSVRRTLPLVLVCVLGFGALAGVALGRQASTVKMTATLRPVKAASGSGRFTGTLLSSGSGRSKLSWTLRYQHLSSRVTSAEIVVPAQGKQGTVAVQLCRSCKANAHGMVSPILPASTKALRTRTAWAVVYTKKNPKGEIRGRIARGH